MLLYSTQNRVSSNLALAYDRGYSAVHDAGYSDGYVASKAPENDTDENEDKEVYNPDDSEEYKGTQDVANPTPETPISPTIIKPGTILFEASGIPASMAREGMRLADGKLPFKCRFVVREGVEIL